jgi:DNA-binding response OmpR family regulator
MPRNPPLTVLLVEDHIQTRAAVAFWLKKKGFHVLVAGTVKSALAVGENAAFDVLISDIQLADGNGWELMKQLRAKHRIAGIAASGHGSSLDVARSKDAGFLTHITKPYPFETLGAALAEAERHLDGADANVATPRTETLAK